MTVLMNEQKVALERVFDAPRSRVFECWTRAEHLQHWFGPRGFTIHSCEADARPGGIFKLCMRSPDGKDYWVRGEYREVAAPSHLVISCAADDEKGVERLHEVIDVTFTEARGKTTVAVNATARGSSDEAAAMLKGMDKGWAQTIERLGAHLTRR
jgi:uncharacterized protein YndB with AHSA1/START domain